MTTCLGWIAPSMWKPSGSGAFIIWISYVRTFGGGARVGGVIRSPSFWFQSIRLSFCICSAYYAPEPHCFHTLATMHPNSLTILVIHFSNPYSIENQLISTTQISIRLIATKSRWKSSNGKRWLCFQIKAGPIGAQSVFGFRASSRFEVLIWKTKTS